MMLRDQRLAIASIARNAASTLASVVAHDETLIRMTVRACHLLTPRQHVPSRWMASITSSVLC